MKKNPNTIVLVGGGTGGSVSPLLAVGEKLEDKFSGISLVFVGSKRGVEEQMAAHAGIEFIPIFSGKLRRYFSLKNFLTPFFLIVAFFQSLIIIKRIKPVAIFGTGSFVQVPVMYAGWVLRIPVIIHQQDVIPSLSNKLCSLLATKVTVSLPDSKKDFNQGLFVNSLAKEQKVVVTGNPCREDILDQDSEGAKKHFGLEQGYPTVAFLGGGTGASYINKLVEECLPELTKHFNILHITGVGKKSTIKTDRYFAYEFINEMGMVYAASDIVVSRAGMSTLTELAVLEKLAIIIPMPDSHQEANAAAFGALPAVLVLTQKEIIPKRFYAILRGFLFDVNLHKTFKENLRKAMSKKADKGIADIIYKAVTKSSD